jgi:tRNA pseudouridine55 synthase
MNGVLIIDKPAGLTSHDVVNRVRRILGQRSVGHLGTLDPLATGVLPLVTGSLTRLAQFYTTSQKTYEGVVRFGFATDTYDADGEPSSTAQSVNLQLHQVSDLAARFRGVIEQMPPPFSAKKVHGVPAYKLARKKKEVELKPVQVEIKEFDILGVEGDRASFRARVSSGTYMRSVAHEMGRELGCGAHLESLRRTAVAEFNISDAHSVEQVQQAAQRGSVDEMFVHPRRLLPDFPAVTADEDNVARIHTGRAVNLPELSQARMVKVFRAQKELIAIATRVAGTLFHPSIVFSSEVRSAVRIG